MSTRAVQVSLDDALLRRIDADREAKQRGRSAFIRSAVELYLRAKERRAVDAAIEQAYAGHADELLGDIERLISGQQWPNER